MSYGGSLGKFGKREGRLKDKYIVEREEHEKEIIRAWIKNRKALPDNDDDMLEEILR